MPILRDVLTEPVFNSGVFTTNYLPETYPEGFQGISLSPKEFTQVNCEIYPRLYAGN